MGLSRRSWSLLALSAAAAAAAGLLSVRRLVASGELRALVEKGATGYLGRPLSVEAMEMASWLRPVVAASGVRLEGEHGGTLAGAPKALLTVRLLPLLRREIVVREFRLVGLQVHPRRRAREGTDLERLVDAVRDRPPPERPGAWRLAFERVAIEDGRLELSDATVPRGVLPSPLRIDGGGRFERSRGATVFPFELKLREDAAGRGAEALLRGRLGPEPRLSLEASAVPARALLPYLPRLAACEGTFGLSLDYAGGAGAPRWSAAMDNRALCPGTASPLPRLTLTRSSGRAASWEAAAAGTDTHIRASATLSPDASRPQFLVVRSTGVELGEFAAWLRTWTGAGAAAASPKAFRAEGLATVFGRVEFPRSGDLWSKASGSFVVRVKDGVLWNEPGLLRVLSKLNLTSVAALARGGGHEGVPFKELTARLTIRDGRLTAAEPVVLRTDTMQIGFFGSIDLVRKTVDGQVVVRVLTVVDEVIARIPLVRGLLHGDDGGLVPVWLSVRGPLSDPTVDVAAAKSITAPLWETAGRVFGLPAKALDGLRGKRR